MQHIATLSRTNFNQKDNCYLINNLINNNCYSRVNILLSDYASLIEPQFKEYFAKKFHKLADSTVHRAAEQAKTGKNQKKYFSYLINLAQ